MQELITALISPSLGALVYSIEPTADGAVAGAFVRYAQQPPKQHPSQRPKQRAAGDLHSEALHSGDFHSGDFHSEALVRTLRARRVIYAAPLFTAAHIIKGWHATWLREFT